MTWEVDREKLAALTHDQLVDYAAQKTAALFAMDDRVASLQAERDAALAEIQRVAELLGRSNLKCLEAERQREELLKALRTVEWPCWSDIRGEYCCWACQASKSDGHRGTCVVQAALAPYSEERNGG